MSKKTTYVVPEQDRVSAASKLCYSIGFAGKDTFQVIANNYLMMFLMMVAGLDGAFIGTMMLVARIWDAINDPILGSLPTIPTPAGDASVLTFSPPSPWPSCSR